MIVMETPAPVDGEAVAKAVTGALVEAEFTDVCDIDGSGVLLALELSCAFDAVSVYVSVSDLGFNGSVDCDARTYLI